MAAVLEKYADLIDWAICAAFCTASVSGAVWFYDYIGAGAPM